MSRRGHSLGPGHNQHDTNKSGETRPRFRGSAERGVENLARLHTVNRTTRWAGHVESTKWSAATLPKMSGQCQAVRLWALTEPMRRGCNNIRFFYGPQST